MSDQPLTVAELEALAAKSEEHAEQRRTGGRFNLHFDWDLALARVCRQALAAETKCAEQDPAAWAGMCDEVEELRAERDKLQAFKLWCHTYLDAHGVPHHPPGPHGAEGCRIGDRMDWLMARLGQLRKSLESIDRDVTEDLARPDCTNVLTLHLVQNEARVALASERESPC